MMTRVEDEIVVVVQEYVTLSFIFNRLTTVYTESVECL